MKKVDMTEYELPETVFVRDIEDSVFQGIVLQCLAKVRGITLVEGNLIDTLFGLRTTEGIKGIYAEQDSKHQSVNIKIEINICYGESIPEKAEEIQTKVAEDITRLTGLHVASVHVVFKSVVTPEQSKRMAAAMRKAVDHPQQPDSHRMVEEYSEEF